MESITIVGGSIGCLVAASEAARAGRHVRLIAPRRGLGSGFSSVDAGGRHVDLGARLIEVADEVPPPLDGKWVPGRARELSGHVMVYVEALLGAPLAALPQAKLAVNGHLADDFLATLDLSSLPDLLDPEEIGLMRRQTRDLAWTPEGTIAGASLACHGEAFHRRFVASRAEKLLPARWRHVGADVRHRLWAPLFHPTTLRAGLEGRIERGRAPVQYFAPASGVFGDVVDALRARVESSVELVLYDHLYALRAGALEVDSRVVPVAGELVLGVSFSELARLAGHAEDVEPMALDLAWIEVAADDVLVDAAYVNVMDAANPAYRISFGGAVPEGRRVVCVELGAGAADRALAATVDAGVVRRGADAIVLRTMERVNVSAPTDKNRWLVTRAKAALPPARYIGSVRDLRADTFAEHVLQGLVFGADAVRRAA